jgi:hypothetical protein
LKVGARAEKNRFGSATLKVTLKSNSDEALSEEFLLKSNCDEVLNNVFP